MKWGKLLLGVGWACVLYACSDDDGKDDTIMNMSELTGKYWYYNAWLGDKYGMGQSDLLEVIRFEKGGVLKMMEFGGRRVHAIGTWTGGISDYDGSGRWRLYSLECAAEWTGLYSDYCECARRTEIYDRSRVSRRTDCRRF